jgi:hypothetical protein
MLGLLEQRSAELGVANFGISVTTMEDVFLKVAHGEHQSDPPAATPAPTPGPTTLDSAPHGAAVVAINPHHTAAQGSHAAALKASEFSRVGDSPGADGVEEAYGEAGGSVLCVSHVTAPSSTAWPRVSVPDSEILARTCCYCDAISAKK